MAESTGGASPGAALARWARRSLAALVSVVMFSMMALTTADVAGRYLFNRPIKGSFEISTFLLATLIFAAFPLVSWDREHITVNLFDRWIPATVRHGLQALMSALSTVVVGVMTGRLWVQARLMDEGQHITGFLEWPIAPLVYGMCALSGLTTLILAALAWAQIRARPAGHAP